MGVWDVVAEGAAAVWAKTGRVPHLEDYMPDRAVTVDETRCVGCGACVDVCPEGAITLQDGIARIDQSLCTGCLKCVGACPDEAFVVSEIVALAERPQAEVQSAASKPKPAGTMLATLGGLALAYIVERILPSLAERAVQRVATKPDKRAPDKKPAGDREQGTAGSSGRRRGGQR